jgi:short-subunit dehydrogenase
VQALCPGLTRTEFQETADSGGDAMPEWLWQSAEEVVATSLGALDTGRVVVITGTHNRVAMTAAALLPRTARRKVASLVQKRNRP